MSAPVSSRVGNSNWLYSPSFVNECLSILRIRGAYPIFPNYAYTLLMKGHQKRWRGSMLCWNHAVGGSLADDQVRDSY